MVAIAEIIPDESHELADAAKLRASGVRTNDPVVVAIATARALSFAKSHHVDLFFTAQLIGLHETPPLFIED